MRKKTQNPSQIHIANTTQFILATFNQQVLDVECPTKVSPQVSDNVIAEKARLPEPIIASLDETVECGEAVNTCDLAFKLR